MKIALFNFLIHYYCHYYGGEGEYANEDVAGYATVDNTRKETEHYRSHDGSSKLLKLINNS